MNRRPRRRGPRPWHAALLWCLLIAPLAWWGLPGRQNDDLLFAGQPAWPAERFQAAAKLEERSTRPAGADTDVNPLADRSAILNLTPDEAARAEILRRFRLYSRQPDEMITFMALQRMSPRALDFDPRLYQYGGAWIYLTGAALALAHGLGLTQLSSDPNLYLNQPELFARFYVAARLLSLIAAGCLLAAVFRLGRYFSGRAGGWLALALTALTPVLIAGAVEAKPHVASAAALAWATLAGLAYHRRPRSATAIRLGFYAGLAAAFVLTGLVAAALLGVVALLAFTRPRAAPPAGAAADQTAGRRPAGAIIRDSAAAALIAAAVFAVTNPYLLINSLSGSDAVASNLGNSTAMYSIGQLGGGALRVAELLSANGGGPLLAGALAILWIMLRRPRSVLIAASAGLALTLICAAIGAGKPAEFGRFLVWPAALLCTGLGGLIAAAARRHALIAAAAFVAAAALLPTAATVGALARDAWGVTESRRAAALWLQVRLGTDEPLGVVQEPAPYCTPPLELARRNVIWLPPERPAADPADLPKWVVYCGDNARNVAGAWWRSAYAPVEWAEPGGNGVPDLITWANKPVFIFRRDEP